MSATERKRQSVTASRAGILYFVLFVSCHIFWYIHRVGYISRAVRDKIMTLSEYSDIKKQIVIGASGDKHQKLVSRLKKLYKDEINSPRRYEQITTIGQLIDVLELRDVISDENVALLRNIASTIKNEQLVTRIQEYESRLKGSVKERSNLYSMYYADELTCHLAGLQLPYEPRNDVTIQVPT